MEKFTVTKDHLKLLRRFHVGWQDAETGAPEIDPKRPYGNSSVMEDIHEILTGESIGRTSSKREELRPDEISMYEALHRETESALQIALSVGAFEAGEYESKFYGEWKKVN